MADGRVLIEVILDDNGALKDVQKLETGLDKIGKKAKNTDKTSNSIDSIGGSSKKAKKEVDKVTKSISDFDTSQLDRYESKLEDLASAFPELEMPEIEDMAFDQVLSDIEIEAEIEFEIANAAEARSKLKKDAEKIFGDTNFMEEVYNDADFDDFMGFEPQIEFDPDIDTDFDFTDYDDLYPSMEDWELHDLDVDIFDDPIDFEDIMSPDFQSDMTSAKESVDGFKESSKGMKDSVSKVTPTMGGLLKSVGAVGLAMGGLNVITGSVGGAISRLDTLDNAERVFANMGFEVEETEKMMDSLNDSITGLPTALNDAVSGVQLLASSTNDVGKSEEIFSAMNNAILGFGGNAEQVNNAVVQLSQAFSNGKVDASTWNSMINAGMGPVLNALAKDMNMTAGELKSGLSDGSISVEEFQDSLIRLNTEGGGGLESLQQIAQDSTSGISTSIANAKTAVVRGVADLITGLNEGLEGSDLPNIGEIISKIGALAGKALSTIGEYLPVIIQGLSVLYGIIRPFLPMLGVIAGTVGVFLTVNSAIGMMTKAFTGAKTAVSLLNIALRSNPIGLVITAIALLVSGLIYLYNTNEDFRESVNKLWTLMKEFFGSVGELAMKGVEKVIEGFGRLVAYLKETWELAHTDAGAFFERLVEIFLNANPFLKAGINIAKSIGEGIKKGWAWTMEQMGDLTDGLRDFLPFSPAKRGAFRDIMTPGITNSIAETIKRNKRDPINAMGNMTDDMAGEVELSTRVRQMTPAIAGGVGNTLNVGANYERFKGSDNKELVAETRQQNTLLRQIAGKNYNLNIDGETVTKNTNNRNAKQRLINSKKRIRGGV